MRRERSTALTMPRHPASVAPLDPARRFGPHPAGGRAAAMEGKARYIFPILAAALIVFVVSCVVTFTNIGFRADFVRRWLSAYIIGWPVGSVTGFIAFPYVRRATTLIVGMIERG
jgi:hypothetical protein